MPLSFSGIVEVSDNIATLCTLDHIIGHSWVLPLAPALEPEQQRMSPAPKNLSFVFLVS